ncbi:MAG TPA: hypothetical protein PK156_22480 [Polyangium sp.]|nr:hypothetical protein [Polyangium sp.]
MRMRAWLWAGLLLTGVNCVAILDGDHPYTNGDTSINGTPCELDATCNDANPCTTDTCNTDTFFCEYITQADGVAPDPAQTAFDCKRLTCVGGTSATEDDPQDVPNDNNPCTTDSCVAGAPVNEVLADGTTCTLDMNMGTCVGGICQIACTKNTDCNDGNPCSDDLCNTSTGKCVYTNIDGMPTPGVTQTVGDCKVHICENGVDTEVIDDGDVNDDQNPCTDDLCTLGVPSNPNVSQGASCSVGAAMVCDGNGLCVECLVPDHCVNITETECEKRACVNNTCQIAYQGTDTLASPVLQTAADCRKIVCNGNMGTTSLPDDTDLPFDANPCTKDICTNGAQSNPPEAINVSCGGTMVCNGSGQCIGCTTASQCPGTDDFCKTRTCNGNMCGMSYTPNGTDLPTGQTSGDCKVLECDGMGNTKTSVLTTDLPVDGNACTQDLCNAMGTPSNPPTAINSACSVGVNDACDGMGNCKKSNSKACGAGTECVSTNCVDGVCCNSTCTTLCMACNVTGSIGTCTAVPVGTDDGTCTGTTQSCNGANNCDSVNGQACAANSTCLSNFCVDGVCCNNGCTATCQSCNVAGSVGTCSNLPSGSQDNFPTSVCVGSSQCDGNGVCKKVNGTTCAAGAECLSGNCVDGVCCDTACTADCRSCNIAASLGTCTNVPMGNDDGMCSGATSSCDGAGSCRSENGAACTMGGSCLSSFCVDGFCCNSACSGTCQSCAMASTGSTNGTCANIPAGTDPDNECMTDCNGAGMCGP